MNGHHGGGGDMITVLYKVVNAECDARGLYNAFLLPRSVGVTLASVKEHCGALNHLSHVGSEGFHWRVCVEDKVPPGGKSGAFSWWDVQDENARLPVKEYSMSQVQDMFTPGGSSSDTSASTSSTDTASKAAKGAFKGMAKAMNAVAHAVEGGTSSSSDSGPRVPLIAFKLLDLVKVNDDFALKHGGSMGHTPVAAAPRAPKAPRQKQPAARTPAPTPQQQQRRAPAATPARRPAPRSAASKPAGEPSLMDFGPSHGGLKHASSSPAAFANETRAERLKREYAQKQQNANRVWDDVDQRWVEVDPKGGVKAGTQSAPPRPAGASGGKKAVGVKLGDPRAAAGKSAGVQQAVHARNTEMRASQQKAVAEIRQREAQKAKGDAEEDEVRKRLEPTIKAWSEEYGKKKQLRALLATLQKVLWPGANWKPVGIGDMMDDGKVKKAFFKASRVVHPDKTVDLDAEKRFLAKRIFDALSQAKTEFDEGKR